MRDLCRTLNFAIMLLSFVAAQNALTATPAAPGCALAAAPELKSEAVPLAKKSTSKPIIADYDPTKIVQGANSRDFRARIIDTLRGRKGPETKDETPEGKRRHIEAALYRSVSQALFESLHRALPGMPEFVAHLRHLDSLPREKKMMLIGSVRNPEFFKEAREALQEARTLSDELAEQKTPEAFERVVEKWHEQFSAVLSEMRSNARVSAPEDFHGTQLEWQTLTDAIYVSFPTFKNMARSTYNNLVDSNLDFLLDRMADLRFARPWTKRIVPEIISDPGKVIFAKPREALKDWEMNRKLHEAIQKDMAPTAAELMSFYRQQKIAVEWQQKYNAADKEQIKTVVEKIKELKIPEVTDQETLARLHRELGALFRPVNGQLMGQLLEPPHPFRDHFRLFNETMRAAQEKNQRISELSPADKEALQLEVQHLRLKNQHILDLLQAMNLIRGKINELRATASRVVSQPLQELEDRRQIMDADQSVLRAAGKVPVLLASAEARLKDLTNDIVITSSTTLNTVQTLQAYNNELLATISRFEHLRTSSLLASEVVQEVDKLKRDAEQITDAVKDFYGLN